MFTFQSIALYHQQLLQGATTCEATVLHYIAQIEAQTSLNAFTQIYKDEALLQAKKLDANRVTNGTVPLKKMHGVIIAIKDVICYKNHKVTAASKMLHNFTSIYNATVVDKLLAEDAIIIGTANCDEFAMGSTSQNSVYGPIKNALNPTKVPGGSSGGSAVAVQAKLCMVSLGSDTGGSVRQPADFCGIVGYKPTYGVVSRYGLIAYASSFDQIGILANTVADATTTLQVIAGTDGYDTTTIDLKNEPETTTNTPKKIAYFSQAINHILLDVEIKNAFLQKIKILEAEGHTVTAIDFPLMDYLVPTYYILTTAEASSNLNRYDGVKYGYRTNTPYSNLTEFYKLNRTQGFGAEVKKRIMLGTFVLSSGYYDAYYTKAQQIRQLLVQFMQQTFTQYNFVMLPNTPTTAPTIGVKNENPLMDYLADIYTVLANLTAIPAIALPLTYHSNGMPIGIQLLAAPEQDYELLHFAEGINKL